MEKRPSIAKKRLPKVDETEEQFSIRVRNEALEELRLNKQGFNKKAVIAAMHLSKQSSFFGDLSKKSKPKKKAP